MAPQQTNNFVPVAARPQASSKEKNFSAALRNSVKSVDQRTLLATAGETGKRKVRFSLLADGEDDDAPTPSTKKRKAERAENTAEDTKSASVAVIKDWAKAYCENVIGCSMKNPWDGDSDDESELESESEFDELEKDEEEDVIEDNMGSHRLPDEDVSAKSYARAGSKRKADSISHPIELVERPKKRVRETSRSTTDEI